jgi:EAL domain-containing protein (putative c-di-GMP-specific phosphodiesterase class I)
MRTHVIDEHAAGTAWLEHIPFHGGSPDRIPLASFPFTIGRGEKVDLRVDSTRVSREHARIEQIGSSYHVRDNGSTNGTFLNGERITDAPLCDGDMLVIADVEFSFFSPGAGPRRPEATLVMDARDGNGEFTSQDFVRGARFFQAMLMGRCVENDYEPIVDLQSGELFGYEAVRRIDWELAGPVTRRIMATECRVTGRLHELYRMVAVEEGEASLPRQAHLFLKLDATEIGTRGLADSLAKLRAIAAPDRGLVVEIPDSAFCDSTHFRDLVDQLSARGLTLCVDGFASGQAQVVQRNGFPLAFLKLAPSLVRGLAGSPDQRRQVQSIVRAARHVGCAVIAAGVASRDEAGACGELGCHYAQGCSIHTTQSAGSLDS